MKEVITRNDVRLFITTVSIICVVVFAWADLKSTTRTAADKAETAKTKAEEMAIQQDKMALDIVEIKTILKQRGFSASAFTPILTSTPSNQSAQLQPQTPPQTVVNNYTLPTPDPTAKPTPSPEKEELCVLNICI